jgi:hypothetical protein
MCLTGGLVGLSITFPLWLAGRISDRAMIGFDAVMTAHRE